MGKIYQHYLSGARIWSCSNCHTHLAHYEDIISKQFQGRYGKAYLFCSVVNICLGRKEERSLITGRHTVADIYCKNCFSVLGWKYEEAFEDSQKYKVGKYILERAMVSKEKGLED